FHFCSLLRLGRWRNWCGQTSFHQHNVFQVPHVFPYHQICADLVPQLQLLDLLLVRHQIIHRHCRHQSRYFAVLHRHHLLRHVHRDHLRLNRVMFHRRRLAPNACYHQHPQHKKNALSHRCSSIMKTIAEFPVDFPRVVVVKSSECQTVVQLHATVCHIQRGHGNAVFLQEAFPHRKIKRGVLRQILVGNQWWFVCAVCEPRSIVHIRRCERLPGKGRIKSQVQCISLIMVHRRISWWRFASHRRGIGTDQASCEGSLCLRDLIRVGQVKLAAVPKAGSPQRELPSLNQCLIPRNWPEEVRFADIAVVQPILCLRLKMIRVKSPAVEGDRDPKLVLFIPLTVQRRERQILTVCQIQQRAGGRQ